MNRKAWTIGLSVAILSMLCIIVLAVYQPVSETTPTEPIDSNALKMDAILIRDFDEYYDCILASDALPDDFVSAEMLSDFGEFVSFYGNPENLSGYTYWLNTIDGLEISLNVTHKRGKYQNSGKYHNSLYNDFNTLDISKADTNMLQLKTVEKGIIIRNGVEYVYRHTGELSSVCWVVDNILFTLSGYDDWLDYTEFSKNSPLYYILSASETEFASALALMNAIPTKNDHVTE